jgi:hypothetical protein
VRRAIGPESSGEISVSGEATDLLRTREDSKPVRADVNVAGDGGDEDARVFELEDLGSGTAVIALRSALHSDMLRLLGWKTRTRSEELRMAS